MKKVLILFAIVLCAFSVFASKNYVGVKASPVLAQTSTSSEESDYQIKSEHGYGAEVFYRRYVGDTSFVNGGVSWNMYRLPEGRPNLTSLMAFAGIGFDSNFSDTARITAYIDGAVDFLLYDKTESKTVTIKTGAEFGFDISKIMEITVGCDVTVGFAEKEEVKYKNIRVLPMIGLGIDL